MKKLLYWCLEKIKKPLAQLIIVIMLLSGYWSWDILYTTHGEEQVQQIVEKVIPESDAIITLPPSMEDGRVDSAELREYLERLEQQSQAMEAPPEDVGELSDRGYKYQWWDMILGHISSILGSLAALGVPFYTYMKQRREEQNDG